MALVSHSDYRRLTSDLTSYEGDVIQALLDAQSYVEGRTGRKFSRGTYTEDLPVTSDGRIYPSALPIISVAGQDASVIDGPAIRAWGIAGTSGYDWADQSGTRSVTYVGGYADADVPADLRLLVSRVAWHGLHSTPSQVPAGATSVKVGDVSYSGKLSSGALPNDLLAEIRRWRKPDIGEFVARSAAPGFLWSGR